MIDYHIHSDISGDCSVSMMRMAEAAQRKGLKEICFTEHIDIDFPGDIDFVFDMGEYDEAFCEVKAAFAELNIRKGIEAGLETATKDTMSALVSRHRLDYVIGSKHLVTGLDPFGSELWRTCSQREAYEAYLQECIESVKECGFFDVFGHLGYISKFCPFEDSLMRYADYGDMIDELLKILADKGKGLEVNTSGLKATGSVMPEMPIVKRFFELGGEIVTVGSDAHDEASVGRATKETMQQLARAGFKYVCAFDNRKPRFIAIP